MIIIKIVEMVLVRSVYFGFFQMRGKTNGPTIRKADQMAVDL